MRRLWFGKILGALVPLLLSPDLALAQASAWNEFFVGFSALAPDTPYMGFGLGFERHTRGPISPFADAGLYGGVFIVMGGLRVRGGDASRLSPFAHLQGGAIATFYGAALPVAAFGVGVDFRGPLSSGTRLQVDGVFTTEGDAVLRVSVGFLLRVGR
jgi:hypothetical protein